MSISGIMNIAVSGMQAQTTRLSAAANNIANAATPGYSRLDTQFSSLPETGGVEATVTQSLLVPGFPGTSNVDMASEMLNVISAEPAFKANASVFETGADLWDVLMSIKRD